MAKSTPSWLRPRRITGLRLRRPSREQLVRAGLTCAVLVAVLVATFGVGYRSSDAALNNAGAFLPKGHTVVHVNAESGTVEARAARDLAQKRQKLEVVIVGPGQAYVVNNETNQVWRLPGDSMRPEPVDRPPAGTSLPEAGAAGPGAPPAGTEPSSGNTPNSVHPVTGGGRTYLIDTDHGALNLIDGTRARPVPLDARVDQVVVDNAGTAWALSSAQGKLYEIVGVDVRQRITASMPNEAAHLTLIDNRPAVLLPDRSGHGVARLFGRDTAHPEITVGRYPGGAVKVAVPGADQRVLVAVVPQTDTVVVVDFRTGDEASFQLSGRGDAGRTRSYGRPVVLKNRVYVPDYANRQVVVLALNPLKQLNVVPIAGKEPFDVFARDGRVWINDQYHRKSVAIDGDRRNEIDAPVPGVDGAPASPTPSRTPQATPSRSRPAQPSPSPTARRVPVPDVVGMDEPGACAALTRGELQCRQPVATAQRPGCEIGRVLQSDPAAGSRVAPRTPVALVVCGATTVPAVNGMLIDQAARVVAASNLQVSATVAGVAQRPEDRGKVVGQSPEGGARVTAGTTVGLRYLDPNKVIVPSVVGLDPQQACNQVYAYGFDCAYNPAVPTWQTNVVLGQEPAAGAAADASPNRTPIRLDYQNVAAVHLYRHKAAGEDVRFLSRSPGPFAGWAPQPPIGGVYGQLAGSVAGMPLVNVYQFYCQPNCIRGRTVGYYYSTGTAPPNTRWRIDNGGQPVFSCLDQGYAAAGTARLIAMSSDQLGAWAFAPEGSWEYTYHQQHGNYQPQFAICRVWYGVGGFP